MSHAPRSMQADRALVYEGALAVWGGGAWTPALRWQEPRTISSGYATRVSFGGRRHEQLCVLRRVRYGTPRTNGPKYGPNSPTVRPLEWETFPIGTIPADALRYTQ